jgi:hypothetical protein
MHLDVVKKTWIVETKDMTTDADGTHANAMISDYYTPEGVTNDFFKTENGTVVEPYGTYICKEILPPTSYTEEGAKYTASLSGESVSVNDDNTAHL